MEAFINNRIALVIEVKILFSLGERGREKIGTESTAEGNAQIQIIKNPPNKKLHTTTLYHHPILPSKQP